MVIAITRADNIKLAMNNQQLARLAIIPERQSCELRFVFKFKEYTYEKRFGQTHTMVVHGCGRRIYKPMKQDLRRERLENQ